MNSSNYGNNQNGGSGSADGGSRLGLKFDNALNGDHLDPATVVHRRPSALAMRRGTNLSPYRGAKNSSTPKASAPKRYDTPPSLNAQGYGDGTGVNRSPFNSVPPNYNTGVNNSNVPRQGGYGGDFQRQVASFGNTNLGNASFQGQGAYNDYGRGGYQGTPAFGSTNLRNGAMPGQNPYPQGAPGGNFGYPGGFGAQTNVFGSQTGGIGAQNNSFSQTGSLPGQSNSFGQTGGLGARTNVFGSQAGGLGAQANSFNSDNTAQNVSSSTFSGYATNLDLASRNEGSLSDVISASRRNFIQSNQNNLLNGGGASYSESDGNSEGTSAHLSPAETYAKLVEESQQERGYGHGFISWFKGGGKYTILSGIIVVAAISLFLLFIADRINLRSGDDLGGNEPPVQTPVSTESKIKEPSAESGAAAPEVKRRNDRKETASKGGLRSEMLKSESSAKKSSVKNKGKAASTSKSTSKSQNKAVTKTAPTPKEASPKVAPPDNEGYIDDDITYYGEEGDDSGFKMDDNDFAPSMEI
ncbi:MAG: hypothetical protein ACI376_07935 [Candidatus Bruticola sp.]